MDNTTRSRIKTNRSLTDRPRVRRLTVSLLALIVAAAPWVPASSASAAEAQAAGVVHGGIYSNDFHAGSDLNALANATGKRVTFGGTFHSVGEDAGAPALPGQWSNTREMLDEVWSGKATPFANLSIPASAASIAGGAWDGQINHWVDHLLLYLNKGGGRSLVLAPLQEMNGSWTSYGCNPTAFKQAYRRIVNIVRNRGIDETKVRFAFAPNGWSECYSIGDYYPGDDVVDVIGISAYRWSNGGSVKDVMGGIIDQLAAQYPTKPLVIAQTAAWPSGTKDQWIRDMFSWASSHPHVVAIIYFNFNNTGRPGETDWRVWIPNTVNKGWQDGMLRSSTAYQWPLTSWFQKGPLTLHQPPGKNLCPKGGKCSTTAVQDAGGRFQIFEYAAGGLGKVIKSFYFGNPGDVAFTGDWDGDGKETLGLYRRSDGYVYLRNSNTQGVADISFYFGNPGDIPVAGDFDGDGKDSVSIYRPSEQRFYIINRLGSNDKGLGRADYSFQFGNPGDKPFVGDFNGDGVDTIGLHRESTGLVYFRNSNSTGIAHFQFIFGDPGDKLVAGDWNGDGIDTVGVYRPSNGMIYIRNSNTQGVADTQVYVGAQSGFVAIMP